MNKDGLSVDEAFRWCRRYARRHAENFSVVTFLLPRRLRNPFFSVYAYCRWSDDLADESPDPSTALAELDGWEIELRRAFLRGKNPKNRSAQSATQAIHPIFIALEELFRRHDALDVEPFADLLVAFRRDQTQKSYATFDELLDYCRYSANPVGRILLTLIKPDFDAEDAALSDSICTGLQLANFWQDIARDRAMGRDYLPVEFVDPNRPFAPTLRLLCDDAKRRLVAGYALLKKLPRDARFDVKLFIEGGLAILRAIERMNYRTDLTRPVLLRRQKFFLLIHALFTRIPPAHQSR